MEQSVDEFLKIQNHPEIELINSLRKVISSANDGLTEHVKWNAPSFMYGGDDRVTFRIYPPNKPIQLIFHRGAKVKVDDFSFEDKYKLIQWLAKDRGTIVIENIEFLNQNKDAIQNLVDKWVKATS